MFGFDPAVGVEDEVEGALLEDAGVEGELPVADGVGVVGFLDKLGRPVAGRSEERRVGKECRL